MNRNSYISNLRQKIKVHTEVMQDDGLRKLTCQNCRFEFQNDQYTRGAIWAYTDVMSDLELNYND